MRLKSQRRAWLFSFDERLQAGECLIPLLGDEIQILLHSCDRLGIEFESGLAALMDAAHDACSLQHPEVFGNRLPGQLRTLRELRNGVRAAATELRHEREPHFVAEGGKYGCARLPRGGRAATALLR